MEKISAKNKMASDKQVLINAYENSLVNGGAMNDAIRECIQAIGQDATRTIIAELVNISAWDGRISNKAKAWAATVETAADCAELEAISFYGTDRIHKAHLDQIARAMANYKPAEPETAEPETAEPETAEPETAPAVKAPKERRNSAASLKKCIDAGKKAGTVPAEILASWHVCISAENAKMGKIYSVSLVPVFTCPNCGSCASLCYAVRSFLKQGSKTDAALYKNAWFRNTAIFLRDRERYFAEIRAALREIAVAKRAEFLAAGVPENMVNGLILAHFRWHVSGDFADADYLRRAVEIAREFPEIRFLGFTKNYDDVNSFSDAGGVIPENMSVPFSVWSGMPCENPYNRPEIHIEYADPEKATYKGGAARVHSCGGNCETCTKNKGGCFYVRPGDVVIIKQH